MSISIMQCRSLPRMAGDRSSELHHPRIIVSTSSISCKGQVEIEPMQQHFTEMIYHSTSIVWVEVVDRRLEAIRFDIITLHDWRVGETFHKTSLRSSGSRS